MRHTARSTRSDKLSCHCKGTSNQTCKSKDFASTAEVLVGAELTLFQIHKAFLERNSPFFTAALSGGFVEASAQQISLPDVEPRCFEHVALWLYTSQLRPADTFFKDGKPTYFTLLDLYALADRLDIEGMRNAIVDRVADLAEQTNSVPTPSDTYILYDGIRETAPIRRLILDLFAFKKTDNLIATHPDDWHPSFLRDLICKLKRPGFVSLKRHDMRPWKAGRWEGTKACEACRSVLKPGMAAHCCVSCEKALCGHCMARGEGGAPDWGILEKECKPWLRDMCTYHEHSSIAMEEHCQER